MMEGENVAVHELREQPADLVRRFRVLCEASGIARANRVPLALPIQAELASLERRILAMLEERSAEPGDGTANRPHEAILVPLPRPEPAGEPAPAPAAGSTRLTATVYTDGAAEGNPGPGGYCAIVRLPGQPDRELSGSSIHTTNNKMELMAAIAGLRAAVEAGAAEITVVSDSEYLVKGMTEWLPEWERRGWKTASGQPVKNQDLWQQLAALTRGRQVHWQWIKSHAGHPENERCDFVATAAARRAARARPV